MTFPALMRVGSVEILAAMIAFTLIVPKLRRAVGAANPRVEVQLEISEGIGSEARSQSCAVTWGKPCLIGRASTCAVVLDDPEVSRRHAQLQTVRGLLFLTDLGSHNGTFLNGKRLKNEGIEVGVGDYVDMGNTRISISATHRLG